MKPYTSRTTSSQDREENLILRRMGILEQWVEYFDELLNNQNIGKLEVAPTEDDGQMLIPPSMGEAGFQIISHQGPMGLQPIWLNMEATNYTKGLIN